MVNYLKKSKIKEENNKFFIHLYHQQKIKVKK